jgi:exosortase O
MSSPQIVKAGSWYLDRAATIGANALVLGLWLRLYRSVFNYLAIIFSRNDFRTNQVMLVGVIALIVWQTHRRGAAVALSAPPQLFAEALALALGGSVLYLLVERFLDVNTLSASLFGLASYGLLGLWMPPQRWREGLPAALLLVGTLPFGAHLQTFVGYPMRVLTATVVRDGLAAAGASSIGIDTILVLENGVSHIDLPCSGVKSLWTGMLFLIAATWIDRRRLNLRWLLIALVLGLLLFIVNLVRVATLVVVGQVAGWSLLARMLHAPLGVLGFGAVCAAAVALTSLQPSLADKHGGEQSDDRARPAWLVPALAASVLAMGLVYAPRPQVGLAQEPPTWEFPAGLVTEPEPLRPDEVAWLTREGAESAERLRFDWRGVSGSLMLIASKTWRAQHRPERCFEVYGLSLNESRIYLVTPDFPVRFVSLGVEDGDSPMSAAYWFQSADRTTADYGTRIWADLAPQRDRWVLVTLLFDGLHDPREPNIEALYTTLRGAVARELTKNRQAADGIWAQARLRDHEGRGGAERGPRALEHRHPLRRSQAAARGRLD